MCLSLFQKDHIIRICIRQVDLVRPKMHQKLSSCDREREHLTVHSRNLETEKLASQSAVRSLEAQVAQIPKLRGTIFVGRQKSHTQQAEVLGPGQDNPQHSLNLDRSEEEVAQLRARCNYFWHQLEPTQNP